MNKGRLKIVGTDTLKNILKEKKGNIIGNSILTGVFTLGAIGSQVFGAGVPMTLGYLLLGGFFGYGIVTSHNDKRELTNEIQLREEEKTL